jgi:hypothetical protein
MQTTSQITRTATGPPILTAMRSKVKTEAMRLRSKRVPIHFGDGTRTRNLKTVLQ